jgi:hypothetical protein
MSVYPQYNNNNLKKWGQVPVAHTHNSSCSGGRGQEDSSQPQVYSSRRLYQKNHHKKRLVEEFKK